MSDKCPRCKSELSFLAGEPAHPLNQYCTECGYNAWEDVMVQTLSEPSEIDRLRAEVEDYRNGYKGSCYCCEPVALKNQELRAEVASLKEERDELAEFKSAALVGLNVAECRISVLEEQADQLTQQLAAANGRVERQAQVITEALHELDSSVIDWDSPVLRASQLLQAEVDAALSNLNEDSGLNIIDVLPAERACCGTFVGSHHRVTCPDKADK